MKANAVHKKEGIGPIDYYRVTPWLEIEFCDYLHERYVESIKTGNPVYVFENNGEYAIFVDFINVSKKEVSNFSVREYYYAARQV